MKIHFLKEDALIALKANVAANLANYKKPTNEWIYDYFQGEDPFMEANFECEDFQLYASDSVEELAQVEIQNVRTLYSALINLTDTQASDERLWAGLCHSDLWDYMHKRWNMREASEATMKSVPSRYFFSSGRKRSLFVNTPSKLWWVGRLIYDSQRSDPFELLNYFRDSFSVKVLPLFSNNFMGNRVLTAGLIEALKYLDSIGYELKEMKSGWQTISKGTMITAAAFLNVYGGTHILDYYSKEEIRDKVIAYMLTVPHVQKITSDSFVPSQMVSKQTTASPASIQTVIVKSDDETSVSMQDQMALHMISEESEEQHPSQRTDVTDQSAKQTDDDMFSAKATDSPPADNRRFATQYDDELVAYCEDMRMSYSYKAVLLLALLENIETDVKIAISEAVPFFRKFYRSRIEKGLPAELKFSIYSDLNVDDSRILANITRNPLNALLLSNYFEYDSVTQRFGFKAEVWSGITEVGRTRMVDAANARLAKYY